MSDHNYLVKIHNHITSIVGFQVFAPKPNNISERDVLRLVKADFARIVRVFPRSNTTTYRLFFL